MPGINVALLLSIFNFQRGPQVQNPGVTYAQWRHKSKKSKLFGQNVADKYSLAVTKKNLNKGGYSRGYNYILGATSDPESRVPHVKLGFNAFKKLEFIFSFQNCLGSLISKITQSTEKFTILWTKLTAHW